MDPLRITASIISLVVIGGCRTTDLSNTKSAKPNATIQAKALKPFSIITGGSMSAAQTSDFDKDGFIDIAAYNIEAKTGKTFLEVVWGDSGQKFSKSWKFEFAEEPTDWTRGTSGRVIKVEDMDQNGSLDIVTSIGIALNNGKRSFEWRPLKLNNIHSMMPIGILHGKADSQDSKKPILVTTHTIGEFGLTAPGLAFCDLDSCKSVPIGQPNIEFLSDLVISDIDGDKIQDIVVAGAVDAIDFERRLRLWALKGSEQFKKSIETKNGAMDLLSGDVDGDGIDEILIQLLGRTSDFPSDYAVLKFNGSDFVTHQMGGNHDNHNESSDLVDFNGDKKVDYLQIGVDRPSFGCLENSGKFIGKIDPNFQTPGAPLRADSFHEMPAVGGLGVQCLNLVGDAACDILIRKVFAKENDVLQSGFFVVPGPISCK